MNKSQHKLNIKRDVGLPKRIDGPKLGISIESLETCLKMEKIKRLGFVIPDDKNILDVEWISTSTWYKPWTWGRGFFITR